LCIENRAKKSGLYGNGVMLKITYKNMKSITRSKYVESCNNAIKIYEEAEKMFTLLERQAVRLIGVGIYNLSLNYIQQLSFTDILNNIEKSYNSLTTQKLYAMEKKYCIKFPANINKIFHSDNLQNIIEHMRKQINRKTYQNSNNK